MKKKEPRELRENEEDWLNQIITLGASEGLTPKEIYDMELWEFNLYIKGRAKAYKNKIKDIITNAYYISSFVWNQKPKSLSYYLEKLEDRKVSREDTERKISFAREMSQKLEILERRKEVENET